MLKRLTWQNLLDYINSSDIELSDEVIIYDAESGDEHVCDLVEYNEDGWIPRIVFNNEEELEVQDEEDDE